MATGTSRAEAPDLGAIAARGVVAAVAAAAANAVVLTAVTATDAVRVFDPLTYPPVVAFSALGAVGAAVVYAVLVRRVADPDRTFLRVAAVVLVASFVPDVALLFVDPAATVPAVVVLMAMHVVVAWVSVATLTGRWR